jgi:hypothetical protein
MTAVHTVSDFDNLLVQVVEETLKYCLGESNTIIIKDYLERCGLPLDEVPSRPELFSEELRNIMGFGSRQVIGAAAILEETILERFCKRMGIIVRLEKPVNFPDQVKNLRSVCKGS